MSPSALVCVSEAVAQEIREGWGLAPTVIPNGVDSERFIRGAADGLGRETWRAELGSYVLAVGGIEPRKGTADLLEAFAILKRTHPELSLVLAGGETLFDYREYRAAFEARAIELGIDYRMLGVVPEEALPSLVAEASVLSFVSTKEGFGLAAMEALAAGVPVVARDLPVLREIFGDTVRYATDPASIAIALEQSIGRVDAAAGAALAKSYTWQAAARCHLQFYEKALCPA